MDKNIINKANVGTFAASPLNFMLQVWHSNLSGIDDISAYNDQHGFYESSSAVNRRFEIDLNNRGQKIHEWKTSMWQLLL